MRILTLDIAVTGKDFDYVQIYSIRVPVLFDRVITLSILYYEKKFKFKRNLFF